MVIRSHTDLLKNFIRSQTIIVNTANFPQIFFSIWEEKNPTRGDRERVFPDGFSFSWLKKWQQRSLSRHAAACSVPQAHCMSFRSFGCLRKHLQLLTPRFFSLQCFLCRFPVPEQISVSLQVYRDRLLMCLWNSLAPDGPLMTFSKKRPLLSSSHSPADTGGRGGAHTRHTSRRALSGTTSSPGTGAYRKGHLGSQKHISCNTSKALVLQLPKLICAD